jgi:hypothetical protein
MDCKALYLAKPREVARLLGLDSVSQLEPGMPRLLQIEVRNAGRLMQEVESLTSIAATSPH